MAKLPLSPMLVQYLVGLCCLKSDTNAVDVIIGDMVLDTGAGKQRDIDVTVTISNRGEITHAFKAYEVKHEKGPLDVSVVEQLCIKMNDMPSLTHKGIVSASGFTASAQSKAASHGVALYEFRPWTRPLQEQFPALTMEGTAEACFPTSQVVLCWVNQACSIVARDAPGAFQVQLEDPLFDAASKRHKKYPTFAVYMGDVLLRSTEILFPLEPANTILRTFPVPYTASEGEVGAGPPWPHTHTLDLQADKVYVNTGGKNCRIDMVTINGSLQWQSEVVSVQPQLVSVFAE